MHTKYKSTSNLLIYSYIYIYIYIYIRLTKIKYKMLKFKTKLMDTELWYGCLFCHLQLQKTAHNDPLQKVVEDYNFFSSQFQS